MVSVISMNINSTGLFRQTDDRFHSRKQSFVSLLTAPDAEQKINERYNAVKAPATVHHFALGLLINNTPYTHIIKYIFNCLEQF